MGFGVWGLGFRVLLCLLRRASMQNLQLSRIVRLMRPLLRRAHLMLFLSRPTWLCDPTYCEQAFFFVLFFSSGPSYVSSLFAASSGFRGLGAWGSLLQLPKTSNSSAYK